VSSALSYTVYIFSQPKIIFICLIYVILLLYSKPAPWDNYERKPPIFPPVELKRSLGSAFYPFKMRPNATPPPTSTSPAAVAQ
jgi:hypothetical protein